MIHILFSVVKDKILRYHFTHFGGRRMGKKEVRQEKNGKKRVLKQGETQRKDGRYMFRYKDPNDNNKVKYEYSWRLERTDPVPAGKKIGPSLRELEADISRRVALGATASDVDVTVQQQLEKYYSSKVNRRESTVKGYNTVRHFLETQPHFYQRKIGEIKNSDAISFIVSLQKNHHKCSSSIKHIKGDLKGAFQMAVNDNILYKNPFDWDLKDHLSLSEKKKKALDTREKTFYLDYIKRDKHYSKYYPFYYILFETGVRISEFCGLTIDDIDFAEKKIHVRRQLRMDFGEYRATALKTDSGCRDVRLTDELAVQFQNLIDNRPKMRKEFMVKEYDDENMFTGNYVGGFLTFNKNGTPNLAHNIESFFRCAWNKYVKIYKFPIKEQVTPHICRHTFATSLYKRGIHIKSAQYLLGHSDPSITARIYTDTDAETAYEDFDNHPVKIESYDDLWDIIDEEED